MYYTVEDYKIETTTSSSGLTGFIEALRAEASKLGLSVEIRIVG